ncbi:hypothetical protein [Zhongshania marina]|uniref:Uncharacterized protein n=1 Tax=Zhongshania marina TaxID=2304603 RepID=A0A2S4HJD5_9GAMM|nr:hypothetical protein [Marortus luteolus]POP54088.1 hypothetical protein C0068_02135 [Marortus luteolus]
MPPSQTLLRTTAILLLSLLFAAAVDADPQRQRIEVRSTWLTEMSGVAASQIHANHYWAHNDSGDRGRLFSFDNKGNMLTELRIDGSSAFDWEDMTSFKDSSGAYLLIGDIGDNMMLRPFADVYLVKEPRDVSKAITHAKVGRHYSLIYEDGPHDAEAIAVDVAERFVYILTKRDTHPRLYRFSLDAIAGKAIPLNYLGEIRSIPSVENHKAQRQGGISGGSPTAMEFNADGDMAMIVTLRNTYYFRRGKNQSWLQALNKTPFARTPNRLRQVESGTFTKDGKQVLIGSEGRPAVLEFVDIPAQSKEKEKEKEK